MHERVDIAQSPNSLIERKKLPAYDLAYPKFGKIAIEIEHVQNARTAVWYLQN